MTVSTNTEQLSDLAAPAPVADGGPRKGENRRIVSEGLRQLAKTSHAGRSALLALAHPNGGDLDTEALSFNVIPRLNAPGRLGEAGPSLNLLTADDPAEASMLARQVDEMNTERRRLSQEAWDTATAELAGARRERALPAPLLLRSPHFRTGTLAPLSALPCGQHGRPPHATAGACGRLATASDEKPPNTTEWTAPSLAQASSEIASSGISPM